MTGNGELDIIVTRFLVLTIVTSIYAYVLSIPKVHAWYNPDWVFASVIVGTLFVLMALWSCEAAGVPLTFKLVFLAFVAGGTPMSVWQIGQIIARRVRNGGGH